MDTEKPKSKRIEYLDAVKGLTLLLIILEHTWGSIGGFSPGHWINWHDYMRVPIFWVAAGYTSKVSFSLRRNFKRIFYPYIIMSAISLLFAVFFIRGPFWGAVAGIIYSRFSLYPDLSIPHSFLYMVNGPLWFLTSLFTGYLVYKGILLLKSDRMRIVAALLSLLIAFAMQYLPILLPWSLDTAFFVGPMMLSGHLLRKYDLFERIPLWGILVTTLLYALFASLTGYINLSIRDYGNSLFAEFGAALTGSLVMIYIFRLLDGTTFNRLLAKFNTQALWIFGMQAIFIFIGTRLAARFGMEGLPSILLQLILSAIGGYVCGLIYNKVKGYFKGLADDRRR